ncbi:MAG: DUF4105 domain-containing protein [Gammaproteobacteria bacterium]|nr:DUF4105 domain-containing protein [Gammaproteobacteria bacterium]
MRVSIFFLLILSLPAWSRAGPVAVDDLVEQVQVAGLGQQPAWLALLHYKPGLFSGKWQSQADDDDFFFSAQGRTDPQVELEATLRAMLQPSETNHAQCRFPARWHWLKQQLGLLPGYDAACPKLEAWMKRVGSERLTLIFPVMYLGNPGSSFGHTFLRFDNNESVMLSQALNYAADNDPNDGMIAYVFNGVFGGYTGVFRTRNYFETVQIYSDIENRDIWEYRLDFSPEEIRQLARHIWEVTDIDFDYFFFDENCSYRLLALLDAAKPESDLSFVHAFPLYAIPVDTVRALEQKNLVLEKQYRPSLASQIQVTWKKLTGSEREWLIQLAEAEIRPGYVVDLPLSDEKKIVLLEQAYTLLQFRDQADTNQAEAMLVARSRLSGERELMVVQPEPPESGHDSARVAYVYGQKKYGQSDRAFIDLRLRPAFHDLIDPAAGYVKGSAINVLDLQLHWLPQDDRMRLESLRFFNIVSLNPVADWYAPLSWQLDVRLQRQQLTPDNVDLAFIARGGAGYSADLAGMTLFVMAMAEADASDEYAQDYSLLTGGQLGMSLNFGLGQMLLLAENLNATSGFDMDKDKLSTELQFNLDRNLGLRLGYQRNRYQGFDDEEWFVGVQQYF